MKVNEPKLSEKVNACKNFAKDTSQNWERTNNLLGVGGWGWGLAGLGVGGVEVGVFGVGVGDFGGLGFGFGGWRGPMSDQLGPGHPPATRRCWRCWLLSTGTGCWRGCPHQCRPLPA